jgi:hypothetical protein
MMEPRPSPDTPGKWVLPQVDLFYEGEFRKGTPKAKAFSAADIRAMARNYSIFSEGDRPAVTPGVGIGHDTPEAEAALFNNDGEPNRGRAFNVTATEKEIQGEKLAVLVGDLEVDSDVAAWVANGNLTRVSSEIYEEPPDGAAGGSGCTLKRVALLGFHPPELKLLGTLPKPVFVPAPAFTYSARDAAVRITQLAGSPARYAMFAELTKTRRVPAKTNRFSEGSAMDRAAALQVCVDHGVTTITDATPDDVVIALATALQQIDEMKAQAGGGGTPATAAAEAERQAKAITLKYAELDATVARLTKSIEGIGGTLKTLDQTAKDKAESERVASIHAFAERMKAEGRISVADADPAGLPTNVVNSLLRADNTRLHKFSDAAGKEQQKTDLQLRMQEVEQRPARKFSEKVAAGGAPQSADRFAEIRAKVAAEKAPAGNKGKTLHERLHLLTPSQVR